MNQARLLQIYYDLLMISLPCRRWGIVRAIVVLGFVWLFMFCLVYREFLFKAFSILVLAILGFCFMVCYLFGHVLGLCLLIELLIIAIFGFATFKSPYYCAILAYSELLVWHIWVLFCHKAIFYWVLKSNYEDFQSFRSRIGLSRNNCRLCDLRLYTFCRMCSDEMSSKSSARVARVSNISSTRPTYRFRTWYFSKRHYVKWFHARCYNWEASLQHDQCLSKFYGITDTSHAICDVIPPDTQYKTCDHSWH